MNPIAAVLIPSLLVLASNAWAANTAALPCKTTAECDAQAERIGATISPSGNQKGADNSTAREDQFSWIN